MSIITVSSSAGLASALNAAQAGDTIKLAAGNYGDVSIYNKAFASDVTITSADPTHAAVFGSLSIQNSSGVHIDDVNVSFVPSATTMAWSSAVMISGSQAITITGGVMTGGPAVNGVPQDATLAQVNADTTGNVLGLPAGRGITIQSSSGVTVHGTDISSFDRGVVLSDASNTTFDGNNIHDLRRTAIMGTGDHLTITNNDLHDSNPWKMGDAGGYGDHADFIALFTDPGATTASSTITITGNIMAQGAGEPILGMWVQGGTAGFSNVTISNNAIEVANDQGIMLGDIAGGTVANNTLIEPAGGAQSPQIILQAGVANVAVSGNLVSYVQDQNSGYTGNTLSANTVVQSSDATASGYYDATLLNKLVGLSAPQIYATVESGVTFVADTAAAGPSVSAAPLLTAAGGVAGQALIGGSIDEALVGGSGNDTLVGNGGSDTLTGGAGNDLYVEPNSLATIVEAPGGGIDTLITKGDHTLEANVENLVLDPSSSNNWSATGNALNNVIIGNIACNVLSGLDGNDTLDGGAGNDQLFGGNGNDVLLGGGGLDTLTGGAGADTFVLAQGFGADRVTDFSQADGDTVTVVGSTYSVAQVGADTVVTLASGDKMTLAGVSMTSLKAGWISGVSTLFGATPTPVSPPPPPPVSPPPPISLSSGPIVNHAPTGADETVALAWNSTKVFAASDFGFSDIDGNHLLAVKLDTLPSLGSLTDNGVAVTSGQVVSAADIAAGGLVYHASSAPAAAQVNLTFQVQDDGGTANGGVDTDAIANTVQINIAAEPNQAPSGTSSTQSLAWNSTKVFTSADFGFSDPDGNHLLAVKLDTVPTLGTLTDNGVAVTAGQFVSAADIAGGKLVYQASSATPAAQVNLTFQVQDDGGTANGGVNLDPTANTLQINIASGAVNHAPSGTSSTQSLAWHTTKVLSASDFGFSDPDGNHLLGVKISGLPTAGTLTDNGAAVKVGQLISAADIAAGKFVYQGPSGSSAAHVDILFQVKDDGGTANGGVDTDPTPNDLHFDIGAHITAVHNGWIV